MQSAALRAAFIQFFKERGHVEVAPAPLINKDDPSLLFVNAGMNPFKDIILGYQPIVSPRVVSVQPCLRVSGKHNDLEEVGRDSYHHTLFEMLGNWSFGDYFKEEAICWAWALLTEVYQLPKERLYVTVFAGDREDHLPEDSEAAAIWAHYLPPTHILRFGKKDNFWEMGAQGPCGPCSEIHIDIRTSSACQALSAVHLVNKGHPQVIEIWNLVFMEYNRQASGNLLPLPCQHVDTGMGLERLAMVVEGKTATYDSDLFSPLMDAIAQLSKKSYNQNETIAVAMRVVADHLRAATFAIADGGHPAATKTGYVIRRILRRAIRYGYSHLGIQAPFIYQLVAPLVGQLHKAYPQLSLQQQHIEHVIYTEEVAFLKTLATGLQLLNQAHPSTLLSGQLAFELYDTYGFPIDLTRLISSEKGMKVDEAGFEAALAQQRARSRQDHAIVYGDWQVVQPAIVPRFVGYDQCQITTTVVQWRTLADKVGKRYQLVLAATPFYPEGGGQVADQGVIIAQNESIAVESVTKAYGLILHTVHRLPSSLEATVVACVDEAQRIATAANHTATHLLHAALKKVLGSQVTQRGSLVTATALRFDFAHPTKPTADQLCAVEAMVNRKIRANIPCVEAAAVPLEEAKAMGAQALFGEKYGALVRVITFDSDFSIELCGGTHLATTGQIGYFKLISEASVGSGIRRVEAVTGEAAASFVTKQLATLATVATLFQQPRDLVKAVENVIHEKRQLQKQWTACQQKIVQQIAQQLPLERQDELYLLVQAVEVPYQEALKEIAFYYKARYKKIFVALAAACGAQAHMVILLSDGLRTSCNAHALMQAVAPCIGGRGGGEPLFAAAGGNQPQAIPIALQEAKRLFLMAYLA